MDGHPSSSNAESAPPQKRQQPPRTRRGGQLGTDIDHKIYDALKSRDNKPILASDHPILLTTDSTYAHTALHLNRVVKEFAPERYYDRPEVIESFRKKASIPTPKVVSLKDHPNGALSRFRPRPMDKTLVTSSSQDEVFTKRHKKFEAHEKKYRRQELEGLKQDHRKLKERMDKYKTMDCFAFLSADLDDVFSSPTPNTNFANQYGPEAEAEGERRRADMLDGGGILDQRYRTLLQLPSPTTKKAAASKAAPAPVPPLPSAGSHHDRTMVGRDDVDDEDYIQAVEASPMKSNYRQVVQSRGYGASSFPLHQAYSKPNAVASGSGSGSRKGRGQKGAGTTPNQSSKGKKPSAMPAHMATSSPQPPTSATPTSTRAMSLDTNENDSLMEVPILQTPLPAPSSVSTRSRRSVTRLISPASCAPFEAPTQPQTEAEVIVVDDMDVDPAPHATGPPSAGDEEAQVDIETLDGFPTSLDATRVPEPAPQQETILDVVGEGRVEDGPKEGPVVHAVDGEGHVQNETQREPMGQVVATEGRVEDEPRSPAVVDDVEESDGMVQPTQDEPVLVQQNEDQLPEREPSPLVEDGAHEAAAEEHPGDHAMVQDTDGVVAQPQEEQHILAQEEEEEAVAVQLQQGQEETSMTVDEEEPVSRPLEQPIIVQDIDKEEEVPETPGTAEDDVQLQEVPVDKQGEGDTITPIVQVAPEQAAEEPEHQEEPLVVSTVDTATGENEAAQSQEPVVVQEEGTSTKEPTVDADVDVQVAETEALVQEQVEEPHVEEPRVEEPPAVQDIEGLPDHTAQTPQEDLDDLAAEEPQVIQEVSTNNVDNVDKQPTVELEEFPMDQDVEERDDAAQPQEAEVLQTVEDLGLKEVDEPPVDKVDTEVEEEAQREATHPVDAEEEGAQREASRPVDAEEEEVQAQDVGKKSEESGRAEEVQESGDVQNVEGVGKALQEDDYAMDQDTNEQEEVTQEGEPTTVQSEEQEVSQALTNSMVVDEPTAEPERDNFVVEVHQETPRPTVYRKYGKKANKEPRTPKKKGNKSKDAQPIASTSAAEHVMDHLPPPPKSPSATETEEVEEEINDRPKKRSKTRDHRTMSTARGSGSREQQRLPQAVVADRPYMIIDGHGSRSPTAPIVSHNQPLPPLPPPQQLPASMQPRNTSHPPIAFIPEDISLPATPVRPAPAPASVVTRQTRRTKSISVPAITAPVQGQAGESISVSTSKKAPPKPRAERCIIMQISKRGIPSKRSKPSRHITAFGVKLPTVVTAGDDYDYELPEGIMRASLADTGPDGESVVDDENCTPGDEIPENPPILPRIHPKDYQIQYDSDDST